MLLCTFQYWRLVPSLLSWCVVCRGRPTSMPSIPRSPATQGNHTPPRRMSSAALPQPRYSPNALLSAPIGESCSRTGRCGSDFSKPRARPDW